MPTELVAVIMASALAIVSTFVYADGLKAGGR
jgi:hypothetical protein